MKKSGTTTSSSFSDSLKENDRLKRVIEASNTGIWEWNIKTNTVFFSPRWKELLGYKDEELENEFSTWQNNLHPDDHDRMVDNVNKFLQNPVGAFEHRFRMKHKKGNYVWILNRSAVTLDEEGKPEYMSGSHLDITDTVEHEESLAKSEIRFRNVFEHSPMGKSLVDADGRLMVNKRFLDILGYSYEELKDKHWKEITHPDDIEVSENAIKEMLTSEDPVYFRKRYLHKDGHYIWTEVSSVVDRDKNGEPLNFFTTINNIEDKVKYEEALIKSEQKFKSLFMSLTIPLCQVDGDGNMVIANQQFTQTFGYTLVDIPNLDTWWINAYPNEDYRKWVLKNWGEAVDYAQKNKTDIRSDEYQVTCKDGTTKTIVIGGFPFENGFLATFFDISDRVKAELELIKSKVYYETIIQTANAILVVLDNNGNVTTINKTGEKIIGRTIDEIKYKNWFETIVPRNIYPEVYDEFERLSKGGLPEIFENPILTKEGKEKIISWRNSHLKVGDKIMGIVSFGTDITEQKLAEEALHTANEQLKRSNTELEHFAYVASHDLQEPLRKIKNYVELFEERYSQAFDEKAKRYLEIVSGGVSRMQRLIDDLLQLSRVSTRGKEFSRVDLNEVLSNSSEILELSMSEKNASIVCDELPVINGDRQQLIQLFQNLISNSIKYNRNKPVITIKTKTRRKSYTIEFSDNGIGFDTKFLNKIFIAFQRLHSREEYAGSGIGLAICKKIVERHGGSITADSTVGVGSTFILSFPKPKLDQ